LKSGFDVVGAGGVPASWIVGTGEDEAEVVGCGMTTLLFGVCAAGPSHAIASVAMTITPAPIATRLTPQNGHDVSVVRQ